MQQSIEQDGLFGEGPFSSPNGLRILLDQLQTFAHAVRIGLATRYADGLGSSYDRAQRARVAIVRDGNKVTVYLNGRTTREISGKWPHKSFSSSGKLFIGGRSDSVANFEGRIDEVAVYYRALSPGEIARHFAASGKESGR